MSLPFRHRIPVEIEEILESTGQYDRLLDWLEGLTESEREIGYNEGHKDGEKTIGDEIDDLASDIREVLRRKGV